MGLFSPLCMHLAVLMWAMSVCALSVTLLEVLDLLSVDSSFRELSQPWSETSFSFDGNTLFILQS